MVKQYLSTCIALADYRCPLSDAVSLNACTVDSDSSSVVSAADKADVSDLSSLDQTGTGCEDATGEPVVLVAAPSDLRRCPVGTVRSASLEGSHSCLRLSASRRSSLFLSVITCVMPSSFVLRLKSGLLRRGLRPEPDRGRNTQEMIRKARIADEMVRASEIGGRMSRGGSG